MNVRFLVLVSGLQSRPLPTLSILPHGLGVLVSSCTRLRRNKRKKTALWSYTAGRPSHSETKADLIEERADRARSKSLHSSITLFLILRDPVFEFRFSVFQGQWPPEMSFLKVPTYVGEVHTQRHSVCVCVVCECVREEKKKEVMWERGWCVCLGCSSALGLRNVVSKSPVLFLRGEQNKTVCQLEGVF